MADVPPIERDVPVPPLIRTGVTALMREMKVGDSRLISEVEWRGRTIAYRVFGKGNFRTQKVRGGIRIWRIG